VSSIYRILCLSHDPAIVIEYPEWHSGADGRNAMEAALAGIDSDDRFIAHQGCALVGGRYSSPLIEVYCPPARDGWPGHYPRHSVGRWIDTIWLRLLSAVHVAADFSADTPITAALAQVDGCWSRERLRQLRFELEIADWWPS
jgi:hypothetical protein